ncbi:MAG: efflux RND transporter periplasmic adaptor subunit [Candidatus Binatia bacterium]
MDRFLRCLLTLTAPAALLSCSRHQPPAMPPPRVTVSQPQVATVTNWDEYPGHLEAVEMVEIRPRVSGYIDSIHFTDGAEVKASDLLFVIDPRPYQAELDRARARFELAENDLQRAEVLRGTKAISEEEYDSRSKAAREAKAALEVARLDMEYTRITAPINGKIGRRLVTVGNLVQGGGGAASTLATLVSMDPIYCYFDAPEAAFLRYRNNASGPSSAGQTTSPVTCELALVGEQGFPHNGRVDFFDNQVNPRTGTIRLRGVFANADRVLVPGMFATARIPAGPPEPTLLIPDVAVGFDQNYKFVYVVNATNVVETRVIETGPAQGPLRAVLKGLTPQDRVVVNGLMMVHAGANVEAQEGPATGALPAGAETASLSAAKP